MAKTKEKVSKKRGVNPGDLCPYCGLEVETRIRFLENIGHCIYHKRSDKICAVIPFPTVMGANEFLNKENVVDVWRNEKMAP